MGPLTGIVAEPVTSVGTGTRICGTGYDHTSSAENILQCTEREREREREEEEEGERREGGGREGGRERERNTSQL